MHLGNISPNPSSHTCKHVHALHTHKNLNCMVLFGINSSCGMIMLKKLGSDVKFKILPNQLFCYVGFIIFI
uniref:Uncharacterized protein n=1 Tax=Rhizophora mucronata TaxID=61149 RepID=A0A2P2QPR0_RHIMU